MNLYIETKNGVTKNHPAFEHNLIQAFGAIPTQWEPFTRVECPYVGIYQTMDSTEPVYAKVNDVWTDVWTIREMTAEEKTVKQQAVITAFNTQDQASNWAAWTFDEATCEMVPPIPYPEPIAGTIVLWCGADNNWKEAPARPVDNNQYKFDFFAWQWVEITQ